MQTPATNPFPRIFEPIRLGSLELANRIIFPAVTTYFDTHFDLKGEERSAPFYAEVARGGAGLIVVAGLQALYPGRRDPPRVALNDDRWLPHLKRWADTVHECGAKIAAQLAVWNYWAPDGPGTPAVDVSPSGIETWDAAASAKFKFTAASRPLTLPEIKLIEEQVAVAAVRARRAGCDALELSAVAGNLLNRFISPLTNRRQDDYGGSLENRLRFLIEMLRAVKTEVGEDFPVIVRISADDMLPGGLMLKDAVEFAPLVEAAGADAISVFAGWYESSAPKYTMQVPPGSFNHLAAAVKGVVRVPVGANIRITDPAMAEALIADGQADLIALGRPLVADPELPNKAKTGRTAEIRRCTGCCTCLDTIMPKEPIRCAVNARVGDEAATALRPALVPKNVWVIGGGPGGMEAARIAARRGHCVTLFEQSGSLGGQLRAASVPPGKGDWLGFIDYLRGELARADVAVKLDLTVTPDMVTAAAPDAVILATGARPWLPEVAGLDRAATITAVDVLLGREVSVSSVLIVGGGLVGCETAEYLAAQGKAVTIVEMLPEIGADIGPFNRGFVLDRLAEIGIECLTNARVAALSGSGVIIDDTARTEIAADAVIFATGSRADDALRRGLEGSVPELISVGDCADARGRVLGAVSAGYRAGLAV